MLIPPLLLALVAAWILAVVIFRGVVLPYLSRRPTGSPLVGLVWRVDQLYCRLWHRVKYTGGELVPASRHDLDGLIVVSNHTGPLDPLLIQARLPFLVRWMMASDMMTPAFDWLWTLIGIIPVARDGSDSGPLREAIRYLRAGGVVGVFPEGRISVPPREIRPFLRGVGLMIAKTRAPVLLVWVSGTPDTNRTGEAMTTRSASRVAFLEWIEFDDTVDIDAIVESLRQGIADASGWPLNDEVLPPGGPRT